MELLLLQDGAQTMGSHLCHVSMGSRGTKFLQILAPGGTQGDSTALFASCVISPGSCSSFGCVLLGRSC